MQNLAKTVIRELAEVLKPESFQKKKNRFFHEGPDSILWIEVQKSRDSSDDRYIFTINLGSFLPILARTLGREIREFEILNGHWNTRLGLLLPVHDDYWWEVTNTEQAAVIGREVADLVEQYGLPALRRAGTISGLIGFFETGPGIIYAGSRREEVLSALKQLAGNRGSDA